MNQSEKKKLKGLIEKDKSKKAIELLLDIIKKESQFHSTIRSLKDEYNHLNYISISPLNTFSPGDLEPKFNNLNSRLLELIENVSDIDVFSETEERISENAITFFGSVDDISNDAKIKKSDYLNPILFITFDQKAKLQIKQFFRPLNFEGIRIEMAESYNPDWNDTADLTIWDNRDLPYCPTRENMDKLKEKDRRLIYQRLPFLEKCLGQLPSPHFIHFGETFFLVNEFRHCINAANSFYTLFGRIRETLDYINTYRINPIF